MIGLLEKVFVVRYYKINAGFFLFVFLVLFGIMNTRDILDFHHAVMSAITGSFLYLGVATVVWALYWFKCVSFSVKQIYLPENSFFYNMQSVGNSRQLLLFLRVHLALYFPMLVYGILTAIVGAKEGNYLLAACVIVVQLLLCFSGALISFQTVNGTWKKPLITFPSFDVFEKKSFPFYLLHYSLHSRKGTFIGIKFFSLLLLQIMVAANSDQVSKEAICVLIMFPISGHSLLPFYYVQFMETELACVRNLPIGLWRRFSVFVLTYAILFLPELAFLLYNEHAVMPMPMILSLYALAVSQMSLYTSLQYLRKMTNERYTSVVFGLFFTLLLLSASVNLWVIFAAEAILALVLFFVFYDPYEVSPVTVE